MPGDPSRLRYFALLILFLGIVMIVLAIIGQWLVHFPIPGVPAGPMPMLLRQFILLIAGCYVAYCGWRLLGVPKEGNLTLRNEKNSWPEIREVAIAIVTAAFITIIDIFFSKSRGLLAYTPVQDGITYMLSAKFTFLHLGSFLSSPVQFIPLNFVMYSPFWKILMISHFFLFGEGEIQAYSVRFWPIFLLLLLILWIVRRRSNQTLAITAMIITAFLPIVFVNLRGMMMEFFGQTFSYYLSDLRPDLLYAVLLLWMAVVLVENVDSLDVCTFVISGIFLSLAILTKPSSLLLIATVWFVTMGYLCWTNRDRLNVTFHTGMFNLLPPAILVIPWIVSGGIEWVYAYLVGNYGNPEYVNLQSSILSELWYYWDFYPKLMGFIEGWGLLFIGLTILVYLIMKDGIRNVDTRLFAYLGIAIIVYLGVAFLPNKNYFIGLPYYLFLWIFIWVLISLLVSTPALRTGKVVKILLGCFVLYAAVSVTSGGILLHELSIHQPGTGLQDREVTVQIASDLDNYLNKGEYYLWIPAYGYPATLEYYMIDSGDDYPHAYSFDISTPSDIVTRSIETNCKAALVYSDEKTYQTRAFAPDVTYPLWRDIHAGITDPDGSFVLFKTYQLSGDSVDLYVHT